MASDEESHRRGALRSGGARPRGRAESHPGSNLLIRSIGLDGKGCEQFDTDLESERRRGWRSRFRAASLLTRTHYILRDDLSARRTRSDLFLWRPLPRPSA